jgi:hypothetical protein
MTPLAQPETNTTNKVINNNNNKSMLSSHVRHYGTSPGALTELIATMIGKPLCVGYVGTRSD